jgi:hypothetical protein
MGWLVNHFYLKTISLEKKLDINSYLPQVSLICGIMGSLFLMGSTANSDTGTRKG